MIFTLLFELNKLPPLTFQTHPSALSLNIKSKTHSIAGVDSVATYVGSPDTETKTINVSGYFTALIPKRDEFGSAHRVITTLAVASTAAIAAGGTKILDVLETAQNTVSLVAGALDLTAGIIKSSRVPILTSSMSITAMNRLGYVAMAIKDATPCTINWDVENQTGLDQKYIITDAKYTAEKVEEKSGNTLVCKIDLVMQNYGTRVELR